MQKTLFTIFFCLFLGGTLWSQEPDRKPAKYAVLVGVNDYVRLQKLRYTKNDIEALRDELLKIGFEKKNVYCLTSGAAEEKNRPTKENIEVIIETVLKLAKHGDTVIIAMSGHGVEVGGQARFCPPETKDDRASLEDSTVAIGDIFKKFERCDATFKLMLIDACREDPFRAKNVAGAKSLGTLDDPPKGVMLLQSCAKDELSYEDTDLKHGIFTHYFIEGLRGEAANKKGEVTLLSLAAYTIEETQRHALDQFRARQQPYLKGEISDFVLVKKGKPVEIVTPPAAVVPPAPATPVQVEKPEAVVTPTPPVPVEQFGTWNFVRNIPDLQEDALNALRLQAKGDAENARLSMTAAISKSPRDLGVRLAAAQWGLEEGNIGIARNQAQAALTLAPDSADAQYARGITAMHEKDYVTAKTNFSKILAGSKTPPYIRADVEKLLKELP